MKTLNQPGRSNNQSRTSQRRCIMGAIGAVAAFIALPVLTGRAQDAATPKPDLPPVPEASHPCVLPPQGLMVWLPGEGNAKDIYANKTKADEQQAYVPGKVGQAFSLNGTYLKVTASPKTDIGAALGLTFEGWINPSDVLPRHPIFDFNNGETFGVHLWMFGSNGGLMANFMDTTGVAHMVNSQAEVLKANEWQHVALTYDKRTTVATIYVDGLAVGTQTLGPFRPQTTYDLYVGYRPGGLGKGMQFNGLMDEVSFYNRPLTAAEIKTLAGAGAAGKCNPQAAKPAVAAPLVVSTPTPAPTPTPVPKPTPTPTMIPALKVKSPLAIFTLAAADGVVPGAATRLTDALTEELRKAGIQIKPRQHMDKAFDKLMADNTIGGDLAADVRGLALRRRASKEMAANGVLYGKIDQLDLTKNQARLRINLQMVDVVTGRTLPGIEVSENTAEKTDAITEEALLAEIIAKVTPQLVERLKAQVQ